MRKQKKLSYLLPRALLSQEEKQYSVSEAKKKKSCIQYFAADFFQDIFVKLLWNKTISRFFGVNFFGSEQGFEDFFCFSIRSKHAITTPLFLLFTF